MKRKPKLVFFLDHSSGIGGAERVILLLLEFLRRNDGWQCHLGCGGGALEEEAVNLGIPVHRVLLPRLRRSPIFLLNWMAGARSVKRIASTIGADLLYLTSVRAAIYGWRASQIAEIPYLWHMHDFWLSESRPGFPWLDQKIKQALCASATCVIANSHATASHLPASPKLRVVHNGINISGFQCSDGAPFRRQYRIPQGVPLVGIVGRLRPWKGQARFLRVAARITTKKPETRFVVIGGDPFDGDDEYKKYLHQLSDDLNLSQKVTFTGQLTCTHSALSAIDVFVHCGDPEPFGLVNTEAMAMGKPVVAYGHGALPEIVKDNETGLLIAPGDEAQLAEAVLGLLHNPEKAREMGQKGRSRVEKHFTTQRMALEIESLLNHIFSGSM